MNAGRANRNRCPAVSASIHPPPALSLNGVKVQGEVKILILNPRSILRFGGQLKLASTSVWQVALRRDVISSYRHAGQKRDVVTRAHAQRSAGRFFGSFLAARPRKNPAAGRDRRS